MSPEVKKALVRLCLDLTDDVDRQRIMQVGTMCYYAAMHLLAVPREEALRVIMSGKAFDDKRKKNDPPDLATNGQSGPVFRGRDGVLPAKPLPRKIDRRSGRRSKGNQARSRAEH